MQITEHIHALRIPFQVPIAPDKILSRMVYSYMILGNQVAIVDSGVAGSNTVIFEYLKKIGKSPRDVTRLILTHSHPDHLGGAKAIQRETGCSVLAHGGERHWIEDSERQFRERPVPGFHTLVEGPVAVDRVLNEGDSVAFGGALACRIIHTPGHSAGSVSLLFESDTALITGDALPLPNDLPIFDDLAASVDSVLRLQQINGIENLLSSWESPLRGQETISKRMDESLSYLQRIHQAVLTASQEPYEDLMDLCRKVALDLGLPPAAVNPLVARTVASVLESIKKERKL